MPARQPLGQPMGCFRQTSSRSTRLSCVASSVSSIPILLASFQAVSAAMQIQRALQERDEPADGHLHVRVGVAAGEPVTEQDDLFGAAVQQAARLCASAQPDCIVVSSGVHDLCRGKGIRFADGGLIAVKGFDEPIGHFEVGWRN